MSNDDCDISIVIYSKRGVGKSTIANVIEDALADLGIDVTNNDSDCDICANFHVNKIVALKSKGTKVSITTCCIIPDKEANKEAK